MDNEVKKLYRSKGDRMIAVFAAFWPKYFNIDPILIPCYLSWGWFLRRTFWLISSCDRRTRRAIDHLTKSLNKRQSWRKLQLFVIYS